MSTGLIIAGAIIAALVFLYGVSVSAAKSAFKAQAAKHVDEIRNASNKATESASEWERKYLNRALIPYGIQVERQWGKRGMEYLVVEYGSKLLPAKPTIQVA